MTSSGHLAAPLLQHRAHPRVRVLDVVHGIVVALGFRQVEIEIQMLVALAQDVIKTRGIVAHFVAQFAQRDEFTGAFGHRDLFAAAIKDGKLHQGHS